MTRKLAVFFVLSFFFVSCTRNEKDHGSFRVGINQSIKSAPVVLASSFGLFEKEGLVVETEVESSAVDLMNGLFSKKYDLVTVPGYRAIVNSYKRDDFRIIAVLNRNQSRSLVMNAQVLENPANLVGKRIGLATNSAADFTLYRLLLFNNIVESQVQILYYDPADLSGALANGEVDAIISWEPFTSEAMSLLGDNARVVNAHMGRDMYWLLVTRSEIIETRSKDLSALLLALDKAISRLNKNTSNSLKTVATALSLSPDLLFKEWDDYIFHLELPQSLLLSMEQEASWYKERIREKPLIIDFLDLIDGRPLSQEFKRRVSIVGLGEADAP
ncbi:MAG TPA: ABC transporter substrate-binding protein [Treponemataceae bacterium]|nr:ABC transporter substrate-binding protein [Treponemataceae bacterium]